MEKNENEFKVYRSRWVILSVFCALEMSNALLWVTFAPISDLAQIYFGGKSSYYGSTTSINMMANIFLILYGPGTLLAVGSMKYFKLRKTMLIGGVLTVLGSLLRVIGMSQSSSLGPGNTYIVVLMGQSLAALSQPLFLNLPPALAAIWFPVSERDLSTTVGSMFSPIGNAIGQIIPILLVTKSSTSSNISDDDGQYTVSGMTDLMIVELVLCIIPLILAVFLFSDKPPTPPSNSTQHKRAHSNQETNNNYDDMSILLQQDRNFNVSDSEEADSLQEVWLKLKREATILFGNRNYIVLFIAFSIGVGFFNSLLTLLNQIVAPHGYSNDDAGTFGAVFVAFGLVGAGVVGYVMKLTKAYQQILRVGISLCCVSLVLFTVLLYSNNFWPLLFSFGLLGLTIVPMLPLLMENCAESTYPIDEEVSMGFMFVGSNLLGLGFIFSLQYLLELPSLGPAPLLPSNLFMWVAFLVAWGLLVGLFQADYRRQVFDGQEQQKEGLASSLL